MRKERIQVHVDGDSYDRWIEKFKSILKTIVGDSMPDAAIDAWAEELREEWLRGTPARRATSDLLREFVPWTTTRSAPTGALPDEMGADDALRECRGAFLHSWVVVYAWYPRGLR